MIDGTINLGVAKAGSKIVKYRDLTLILHPDEPVKFVDLANFCISDLPMEWAEDYLTSFQSDADSA